MSVSIAEEMRRMSQPRACVGPENPYPGIDGQTTWKAGAPGAPCPSGSLNGPMTSMNSMAEPATRG